MWDLASTQALDLYDFNIRNRAPYKQSIKLTIIQVYVL